MQIKIKNLFTYLKEVFVHDLVNRVLAIFVLAISVVIYVIWSKYILLSGANIFLKVEVNPIKYLYIVIIINILLAVFSFKKEKEISYLLMMGSLILSILIFALEIFYLKNSYV